MDLQQKVIPLTLPAMSSSDLFCKIQVGAVSYINALPLIEGLSNKSIANQIDLYLETPAVLASKLQTGELDIALVPVAILNQLHDAHIIGDYGIASNGNVASVCIFSDVSLEEVDTLMLDYQSRTSVMLAQILLREYWKISPKIIVGAPGFEQQIQHKTAGLVIGDRALKQRNKSKYIYDLAEAWKALTGLPFVFAVWVSNKNLPTSFIESFNQATASGLNLLKDIASRIDFPEYDIFSYYTNNIAYLINQDMRDGMGLFLEKLRDMENIQTAVRS